MAVLILSPQELVRSCSIPFVANSISVLIWMQAMHPHSMSVIFVDTLTLTMFLLVWPLMSLRITIQVHLMHLYSRFIAPKMLIKCIAWCLGQWDGFFLHIAWSSDPQFYRSHYAGLLIAFHNSGEMEQIVVPLCGEFCELFIKELYVMPLAGHLDVQKVTRAHFQRV